MPFKVTTALKKILSAKKQIVVCKSGTSCGKTYNIIAILINIAATYPNKKITVVGVTIDSVRTCADLFCEIMEDTGRFIPQSWNITRRQYYFANKSTIIFSAFEKISTAKASGKRDILFINEGNHLNWEIANELITRTNERIYIDYNPSNNSWIDTEIIPDNDCEVIKLHYTDNEQVHPNIIKLFKKRLELAKTSDYYKNWCKVYIEGEKGILEGTIFQNFKIVKEIPIDAKVIAYGLDFGYSNDPTAMSKLYLYDNEIYIEEMIYQTGLTTNDLIKKMNGLNISKNIEIYADSAQPSMIEEIRRAGYYIIGSKKGKDSVNSGIDILQQYQINITAGSLNTIKEFENYSWKKNSITGEWENVPVDKWNHQIDNIRYIALEKLKYKNGDLKYFII
jgi:phage terminase large subunit